MARLSCFALAAALVACGTGEDERPATLEVVTLTILAPSCGQVQCHSSTTRREELAFDTVEHARAAMIELRIDQSIEDGKLIENDLMDVLLGEDEQMPPDSPLADQDIELIQAWLVAGGPGL